MAADEAARRVVVKLPAKIVLLVARVAHLQRGALQVRRPSIGSGRGSTGWVTPDHTNAHMGSAVGESETISQCPGDPARG